MISAAVDPTLFHPPDTEDSAAWVTRTRDLTKLAGAGPVAFSCPRELQEEAVSRWYTPEVKAAFAGRAVQHHDLMRVLEELRGRTQWAALPEGHDGLIDSVALDPDYEAAGLAPPQREQFREHLGMIALGKADLAVDGAVATQPGSWARVESAVRVGGTVVLSSVGMPDSEDLESEHTIHEHLAAWYAAEDVLRTLADDPCRLMAHLELGIRAVWVSELGGEADDLDFEIGPAFAESVAALAYHRDTRYAGACLRVMALIAGGRDSEVAGHAHRTGRGGNNPGLRTSDGRPVLRSYLAQKSPNAHRLFWLRGRRPTFLNVAGHEGEPALPT